MERALFFVKLQLFSCCKLLVPRQGAKDSLLESEQAVNSVRSVRQGDYSESFNCQMLTRIFELGKIKGRK